MSIRATAATGLALAALAAGCGGDSEGPPIPADAASDLQRQLDSVAGRIREGSAGACLDVIQDSPRGDNVTNVNRTIDSLPARVDEDVRDALQRSFDHLFDLVNERCSELEQTDTDHDRDGHHANRHDADGHHTHRHDADGHHTHRDHPHHPHHADDAHHAGPGRQGDGSGSGGAGAPGEGE